MTDEEIVAARKQLGIPLEDQGDAIRLWLRVELAKHICADTGRGWRPKDVAAKALVSTATVSCAMLGQRRPRGERPFGPRTDRVRRIIAEILQIPLQVLFPPHVEVRRREWDPTETGQDDNGGQGNVGTG